MTFLNPAGFWLLLGVPALIAIYIIRSRHEDQPVSSTYIWEISARFLKKRLPVQRFRRVLLFLLQLLMILAVSVVAARPAVPGGKSCDYIVIIDSSASMQMENEAGESRFQRAVRQAQTLSNKIAEGHTMSLIFASDNAACPVRNSTSRSEVRLALKNARCDYGTCNVTEAMDLAQLMCSRSRNAHVVFYTDCAYTGTEDLEVVNLNEREWNVSVESLTAKTNRDGTVFTASLISRGRNAQVSVGLKLNGVPVDAQLVDCPGGEEVTLQFTVLQMTSFTSAEVFIDSRDGLAADNSYVLCHRDRRSAKVLLVSHNPLYLSSALEAMKNCTVVLDTAAVRRTGYDLYIYDGICPDEYPTDGSVLVFGGTDLPDGVTAGETTHISAPLRVGDKPSEISENLLLQDAVLADYCPLTAGKDWTPVLYCENSPVLVTKELPGGLRISVAAFDVHDSNLPLKADFVMLMRNLVECSIPVMLKDTDRVAGETVSLTLPPAADQASVITPGGSVQKLSAVGTQATVLCREVGIYTANASAKDNQEYVEFFVHIPAGELVPAIGSALAMDIPTEEENGEAYQELWFWIAAAALVLLLTEWGWYYREQY